MSCLLHLMQTKPGVRSRQSDQNCCSLFSKTLQLLLRQSQVLVLFSDNEAKLSLSAEILTNLYCFIS